MGAKFNIEDIDLDILYRFMEKGSVKEVPPEIMYYLELLEKIYSLSHKIDKFGSKEMIVKHLIISEKLSKYKASQLYDEAMEYFYVDQRISKKAFRNMYASKLDKILNLAFVTYKGASDLKGIASITKEIRAFRQLDIEDNEEENPLDEKPWTITSMVPEDVGIESVDRNELIEYVNSIPELNPVVKDKILRDASVLTPKLIMNDQENPYKTE
jgi:ribosomal protein L20